MIVTSAGTYVVRESTFSDPGRSISDAIQAEKLCCACLAKMGFFDSLGCGSVLPQSLRTTGGSRPVLAAPGLHQGKEVSGNTRLILQARAINELEALTA